MGTTPRPTLAPDASGEAVAATPPDREAVKGALASPGPAADEGRPEQSQRIEVLPASIVTALSERAIGTRVVDQTQFSGILAEAIRKHDTSGDRVPGQHFISLPAEVLTCVSAGVGKRTESPDDYVTRFYRGEVSAYLKREKAVPVESCAAVVYTRDAYLADPDVQGDEGERRRIEENPDATHILVAVLASAGPKQPLTPHRLVHNLAGGNNEAATWSADEIRGKAKDANDYWKEWCVVAD